MKKVKLVSWTDEYHEVVYETEDKIYVKRLGNDSFFPFIRMSVARVEELNLPKICIGTAPFFKNTTGEVIEE